MITTAPAQGGPAQVLVTETDRDRDPVAEQ